MHTIDIHIPWTHVGTIVENCTRRRSPHLFHLVRWCLVRLWLEQKMRTSPGNHGKLQMFCGFMGDVPGDFLDDLC